MLMISFHDSYSHTDFSNNIGKDSTPSSPQIFQFHRGCRGYLRRKENCREEQIPNQSSRETLHLKLISLRVFQMGAACKRILINQAFQTGDGNRTEGLNLHALINSESTPALSVLSTCSENWVVTDWCPWEKMAENDQWLPSIKSHWLVIKRPRLALLQSSLKLCG